MRRSSRAPSQELTPDPDRARHLLPAQRQVRGLRPPPGRLHFRTVGRLLVATALYSGLRISELLGLTWEDIDFAAGPIKVRAQLSRAHRGNPPQRVPPKTPASIREAPLVDQLSHLLAAHKQASPFAAPGNWVFATARGTPHGHRNVAQVSRIMGHARITITLDSYTHLFDDARHGHEIRRRMATSQFASLLDLDFDVPSDAVLPLNAR